MTLLLTLIEVLGIVAMAAGAALLHPAAGLILGGLLAVAWANAMARHLKPSGGDV